VAGASSGYTAGVFALEIGGQPAGNISSVAGGAVFGVVVREPLGSDAVVRKHIGNVKYEDITITCGIPSAPLADWLRAFIASPGEARNGSIVFLDYAYHPVRELQWTNGLISSVTFPRLDAATKDAAFLTVTITPEYTRMLASTQTKVTATSTQARKLRASNFRVSIPGINATKVSAVEALTVSRPLVADDVGTSRMTLTEQGALDVGDLVLTLSESGASDFATWTDDFVVKGNNDKSYEKQATVTFLEPAQTAALMTVELSGVGIYKFGPMKAVSGSETIARVTASMYCEEISIPPLPAPASGSASTRSASSASTDVSVLAAALHRLLVEGPMPRPIADPAVVARRLMATVEPGDDATDPSRREGEAVGAAWARDEGSLPELQELAASARGEWTAIHLSDGHSLAVALQAAGVVPAEHVGALDLERDSFVEGLVDGASDTLGAVRGHLTRSHDDRVS
jgi:hypothetical protein